MTAPLDTTDRAALATWLFDLWSNVQKVTAIADDATHLRLVPADVGGKVARGASDALDALFARVRPLLTEGGVVLSWRPGVATPEQMARYDVIERAKWEADQAKLPRHKRRTLEQAEADEEQHMGRALRGAAKRGDL
jgi:hypothetical protein